MFHLSLFHFYTNPGAMHFIEQGLGVCIILYIYNLLPENMVRV